MQINNEFTLHYTFSDEFLISNSEDGLLVFGSQFKHYSPKFYTKIITSITKDTDPFRSYIIININQ